MLPATMHRVEQNTAASVNRRVRMRIERSLRHLDLERADRVMIRRVGEARCQRKDQPHEAQHRDGTYGA